MEPVNDPPLAAPDEVQADGGITTDIDVLLNDSDPEGDRRSVVSVDTSSTVGTLVRIGEGFFLYTSPAGFTGVDAFVCTISDPGGLTSTTR